MCAVHFQHYCFVQQLNFMLNAQVSMYSNFFLKYFYSKKSSNRSSNDNENKKGNSNLITHLNKNLRRKTRIHERILKELDDISFSKVVISWKGREPLIKASYCKLLVYSTIVGT